MAKKNHVKNIKNIDTKILNKISFQEVNIKRFPSTKLIEKCLNAGSSASTIVNASNEVLVDMFLSKKIKFLDIVNTINKLIKDKDFKKYARKKPRSINDVLIVDSWSRLKTLTMCVR